MKENKKFGINITMESINKIKDISKNMENKTFHFHTHILYDIRTHLGNKDVKYLEIGSYAGASSSLMSSHPYKTDCFAIDLGQPINPKIVEQNVEKFINNNNSFRFFVGDSQSKEIIKKVTSEIDNIDILFIDGDHSKIGVLNDFNNYKNLVKPGGYICFDDYLDKEYSPEVKDAVDNLVNNLNGDEYDIIGVLEYPELSEFTDFKQNNIYIIQKK